MKFFFFFYRLLLSLRYKVTLSGSKALEHDGPILLLPNHIALVDPRILLAFLGKYIPVSPVASEKYYNKPVLKQIMGLVGTVPIGEMGAGAKAEDVKKVFASVVEELKNGKNILIYPSGQIYRQGFESIVGKQSVYNILKLMPDNTKVIGIKTRGLWGSMRSMAWDNMQTGFFRLVGRSMWLVLANFIFFLPKRKVSVELHDISDQLQLYKNMSLNECNSFLENFYNSEYDDKSDFGEYSDIDGRKIFVEDCRFIPHFFFYDDVKDRREPDVIEGSLNELNQVRKHDVASVSESVKSEIIKKIIQIKELPEGTRIAPDSKLILDLYFDSLDLAELKSHVQAHFSESSNPPIGDLKTVADMMIMAVGKSESVEELKECNWGEGSKNSMNLRDKLL